jgi:hypothetical protein
MQNVVPRSPEMDNDDLHGKRLSSSGADDIGSSLPFGWRESIVEHIVPSVVDGYVAGIGDALQLPDQYWASITQDETGSASIDHVIRCSKTMPAFTDATLPDADKVPNAELPDLPDHKDWISGKIPWRSGTSYVACGLCYNAAEIDSAVRAVHVLKSGTSTSQKRQGSIAARALEAVLITNRYDAALHMVCGMHTENAAAARQNPAVQAAPASAAQVGDCDIRALVTACHEMVVQSKASLHAASNSVLACTRVGEKIEELHNDILAIQEFLKMPDRRFSAARGGGGGSASRGRE